MTVVQALSLFGLPSLSVSLIFYLGGKLKKNTEDTNAVKLGVQALLRSQLISEWNKWSEYGYAPIYARENFENIWKQYHNLGANGVMDDIREKFLRLPTKRCKDEKEKG